MKTATLVILIMLLPALQSEAQFPFNNRGNPSNGPRQRDTAAALEGFVNYTQAGIGVRLGKPVFSLSTVNGYQLNSHIALGGGIGYSHTYYPLWSTRSPEITYGPPTLKKIKSETIINVDQLDLFAEMRLFTGRKGLFYILFDAGYSVLLSQSYHVLTYAEQMEWLTKNPNAYGDTLVKVNYTDRFFLSPGAGCRIKLAGKLSLNIALQLYVSIYRTKQSIYPAGAYDYADYPTYTKASLYPLLTVGIGYFSKKKNIK